MILLPGLLFFFLCKVDFFCIMIVTFILESSSYVFYPVARVVLNRVVLQKIVREIIFYCRPRFDFVG